MTNINEKIKDIINKNDVVLFMKGTPEMPQCGFSMTVCNILKELKVKFSGVNVLADPEIRQGIKDLVIGQLCLNFILKENLLVAAILLKKCTKKVNYKKFLNKNYLE